MVPMNRILIVGATGNVGGQVLSQLTAMGAQPGCGWFATTG
jgi:nucleoside-diphosphate-sugar epimerase